ncbi:MAG: PQQ-binding-like beta-propeller repeat protein [Planctomycetota bacterium]
MFVLRGLPSIGLLVALSLGGGWCRPAQAEDWPEFRGPTGQGLSQEKNVPTAWSEEKNITWKVPVPGRGWSSPVLQGDQIWLTTSSEQDTVLRAICLDRKTGQTVHDVELFRLDEPPKIHDKNTPASPSALIEGDRVYVHFGVLGTACLARDGKIVWKTQELTFRHGHGPAGSPVVYQDLLLLNCDGTDRQFMAALDKTTGKLKWEAKRNGSKAYSTPLVIKVNGQDQIVSTAAEWVYGYEAASGKELWKVRYPGGYSNVPRPVFGQGLVFVSSGYNTPVMYAIRPTGQGDVTNSHVAWQEKRGAPHNPSPLLVDDYLYTVSDGGVLTCRTAQNGEQIWQQRIPGGYSASLVFANGNIYAQNETGVTTVFKHGAKYEEVAVNKLPGRTLATLAISNAAIYLRTDEHLFRIDQK